jgi:site-specific recombinase XerD
MAEDLESLRSSFNRSLRVEGKADRTLVLYGQSIMYFADWLRQRGRPTDLSALDRDTVLQWFDYLRHRGLTTGTIRTRWRGLRGFANWLLAEDIIRTDHWPALSSTSPSRRRCRSSPMRSWRR